MHGRRALVPVVLFALAALVFSGAPVSSGGSPGLQVVSYKVADDSVRIYLANGGDAPQSGLLVLRVLAGGKASRSVVHVSVPAHGTAMVTTSFGGSVSSVIYVGITEGPDPIPQ